MRLWSEVQGRAGKHLGLPTLEVVINKAEAEEQAKLAQSKLSKGVKLKIAAVEVDKKFGDKLKCKFGWRTGHIKNPETKAIKK